MDRKDGLHEAGELLLQENAHLKTEIEALKNERIRLQQTLRSQGEEAVTHITELEEHRDRLEEELRQERNIAVRHKMNVETLEKENIQLQKKLQEATDLYQNKLIKTQQRLDKCEENSQKVVAEITTCKAQLRTLEENKKTANEQISRLEHEIDRLSDELRCEREAIGDLEKQHRAKDHELQILVEKLSESKDLVEELRLQLTQHPVMGLAHNSTPLRYSLFDELSASDSSSFDGALSLQSSTENLTGSTCSDTYREGPGLHRFCDSQQTELEVSPEIVSERLTNMQAWLDDCQCLRCKELMEDVQKTKMEVEYLNKQLLVAVQQKFELQQQNEEWQSDMAIVVQEQVRKQLQREVLAKRRDRVEQVDRKPTKKFTLFHHIHS